MPATYLTKDGFQKLQDELDQLRTVKRQEVAERLHEAMEGGELIENAEYEAAKNEQAFVEGRIQELEIILAAAHLIDEAASHLDPTIVSVGDTVVIQEDGGSPEEYTIVGAAEADPRSGKISNESPLGRALINHHPGDIVTVDAPGGAFKVKVIKTT
jgi:transcription elongation factor GreA